MVGCAIAVLTPEGTVRSRKPWVLGILLRSTSSLLPCRSRQRHGHHFRSASLAADASADPSHLRWLHFDFHRRLSFDIVSTVVNFHRLLRFR